MNNLTVAEIKLISFALACYLNDSKVNIKRLEKKRQIRFDKAREDHAKVQKIQVKLNPECLCGELILMTGERIK